jgi:SNF2 family DNA or RNA helicase
MITNEKKIHVDFEAGKFLIYCPPWANDALNSIDPKRWSKAKRAWSAPAIRRNVEAVEALKAVAEFSEKAIAGIEDAKAKLAAMKEPGKGFPAWYPFKTQPLAKQVQALNKAYGLTEFAMHMDRGTGKSKVAIDLSTALRMEAKIAAVLVIVRRSLRLNWVGYDVGTEVGQREGFIGHCPIPVSCYLPDGGDEAAMKKYQKWLKEDHEFPILIMSVESFSQGGAMKIAESFLTAHANVMTMIDESQDIANHDAIRSKRAHQIGRMSEYRLTLTGSPISTGPMNLFSQFEFLNPNVIGLGDYYAFRNRYALMGGFPNPKTGKPTEIIGYQNMDELAILLAPYVFECRKSEVIDLPPKVFERVSVQLSAEQRALYRQIKKEQSYEFGDKTIEVQNTLELALRLHQVCGGFISFTDKKIVDRGPGREPKVEKTTQWKQIIPAEKNAKLQELFRYTDMGKPTIIWAAYKPEIAMIVEALKARYPNDMVVEIHGTIPDDQREINKALFQEGKALRLVGNTQTGGTGHTLTAAEMMLYWNNTEKMLDREQSEDRAHRHGLKHSVLYVDFVTEKTVDETIIHSIEEKMDLAEYIRQNIRRASDLLGEG